MEYLHTLAETARVQALSVFSLRNTFLGVSQFGEGLFSSLGQVGEMVRRGQVLCESGDIGFAPEPSHGFSFAPCCDCCVS